ncbi:MAG: hypothetical protein Q9214_000830 [Letrouitia sp. 1 TL-2023]
MLSFFKTKTGYTSAEDGNFENVLKLGEDENRPRSGYVIIKSNFASAILFFILFLAFNISTWILFFNARHMSQSSQQSVTQVASQRPTWVCQRPANRREWRTLSDPEKLRYVTAVKCLSNKPSKLRNNGSLYDDYPWLHMHLTGTDIGIGQWTGQASKMRLYGIPLLVSAGTARGLSLWAKDDVLLPVLSPILKSCSLIVACSHIVFRGASLQIRSLKSLESWFGRRTSTSS